MYLVIKKKIGGIYDRTSGNRKRISSTECCGYVVC